MYGVDGDDWYGTGNIGCYPFFDGDPFLLKYSPGIYAIGNQPAFASDLVISSSSPPLDQDGGVGDGAGVTQGNQGTDTRTRVVLVPRFSKTGEVVLVHSGTLAVKTVRFGLAGGSTW